jgi:hypothetical protein
MVFVDIMISYLLISRIAYEQCKLESSHLLSGNTQLSLLLQSFQRQILACKRVALCEYFIFCSNDNLNNTALDLKKLDLQVLVMTQNLIYPALQQNITQ